ncbi:L-2-hydroxyglutarate oxidase [Gryllotalpicola kribbensis]|uniref:L-2-hydroxyglutarate oxidase n=1 Tax=Gryllotalpicola kribbensis TaxID=993084 RepID=A0ABP8AT22_9MICO
MLPPLARPRRIAVIGGGIVGVALARALAVRGLGEVVVYEKERRLAAHQTGHNSGVVHAGLYYAPGSLKAELCTRGRGQIRDFCREKGLPYREVGKLVVAVDESELGPLAEIERRSRENGVPDLERIDDPARMREIEPHVAGIAAVHSPHTAIVDYAAITEALAHDARGAGADIRLGSEVTGLRIIGETAHVATPHDEREFDLVVACAGLQSDLVAKLAGADASPRILPFRGEYWQLSAEANDLCHGMIYPVPDPRFPFLGVHFTRGVYDDVRLGPSAVPALAREGYSWARISLKDTLGSIAWPGAGALLREHWYMGVDEISASLLKRRYFEKARRFVPELAMTHLAGKSAAGVRAQAWGRDGSLIDDFAVDRLGPVTLIRNAPSPAATSSMAIADHVIERFLGERTPAA